MKRLVVAMGILGLAAACATSKKEPPPTPFTATRWDAVLELPPPGEQPYVQFGDGRVEGWGGCNRFSARFVQDAVGARAIVVGRIDTGRRGCDPSAQAAESRFLEVLQSVSSYSITGDTMTMSGSGGSLKFRAHSEEEAQFAGTKWAGVVDASADRQSIPRLEFLREGKLAGFTGCNLLNGTWRIEEGVVRFGPIATTKRACVGSGGEIEKRVVAALAKDAQVSREGGRLVITTPGGERFEFTQVVGGY